MEKEMLAIVDEHDRVIGACERAQAHRRALRHRATHILVFNRRGQLFLQKRSRSKDENPGLWDSSAAGHVDAGEDYGTCALREVAEELGVQLPAPPQPLFRIKASALTGWEFCQVYRAMHDGPFQLNRDEIDEGRWFETAQIDDWIAGGAAGLTRSFTTIWQRFRDQ